MSEAEVKRGCKHNYLQLMVAIWGIYDFSEGCVSRKKQNITAIKSVFLHLYLRRRSLELRPVVLNTAHD